MGVSIGSRPISLCGMRKLDACQAHVLLMDDVADFLRLVPLGPACRCLGRRLVAEALQFLSAGAVASWTVRRSLAGQGPKNPHCTPGELCVSRLSRVCRCLLPGGKSFLLEGKPRCFPLVVGHLPSSLAVGLLGFRCRKPGFRYLLPYMPGTPQCFPILKLALSSTSSSAPTACI